MLKGCEKSQRYCAWIATARCDVLACGCSWTHVRKLNGYNTRQQVSTTCKRDQSCFVGHVPLALFCTRYIMANAPTYPHRSTTTPPFTNLQPPTSSATAYPLSRLKHILLPNVNVLSLLCHILLQPYYPHYHPPQCHTGPTCLLSPLPSPFFLPPIYLL